MTGPKSEEATRGDTDFVRDTSLKSRARVYVTRVCCPGSRLGSRSILIYVDLMGRKLRTASLARARARGYARLSLSQTTRIYRAPFLPIESPTEMGRTRVRWRNATIQIETRARVGARGATRTGSSLCPRRTSGMASIVLSRVAAIRGFPPLLRSSFVDKPAA